MQILTMKQVKAVADRPASPGPAPIEHRTATIAAAVCVMRRTNNNSSPTAIAEAAAVLADAPIEVIARAVLRIVATSETFTIPAFLSVLRAEVGDPAKPETASAEAPAAEDEGGAERA